MSFRHSGPRRHHSSGLGTACGSGFIIQGSPSSLALAAPCVHHPVSPPLGCHTSCTCPPATPRRRGPAGAGAGKVTYSGHNHLTKPVASSQAPGERWRLAAALRTGRDQSLGSRGPGGSWVVVSCGGRVAAVPSIQLYLQPPPQLVLPISSQSIAMLHTLRLCVCCQATRLETKICPLLSTM